VAGALEEQKNTIGALKERYLSSGGRLQALEDANAAIDAARILVNPHTTETIFSVRIAWDELGKLYARTESSLVEQIMAEKGAQITPEQYKEIKEVFDFFDQDHDRVLNLQELKDACQGIGLLLSDEEVTAKMHSMAPNGKLTFEQWSEFMLQNMSTGSSESDVEGAFVALAGGDTITRSQIDQSFPDEATRAYLYEKMPASDAAGESFDVKGFTKLMFAL
jgi:hypothetical protein